jgi:hypothetical protein
VAPGKNQKNGKINNMNNKDFDKKIKEMVDSYEEPLMVDMWGDIEAGLKRRRAVFIVRRVATFAVAASLVIALVLNIHKVDNAMQSRMVSSVTVKSQPVEIETASCFRLPALAYLVPRKQPAPSVNTVAKVQQTSVPAVEVEKGEAAVEDPMTIKGEAPVQATKSEETVYDWDMLEEEEVVKERGKVVVDLLSNLLALGGNSDFSKGTTMYMPGTSMEVQQTITPISKPTFALPFSVGLNLHIPFSERFGLGTGLKYSYLQNSFQALVDNSVQAMVDQKLHYIGIPLSAYYKIMNSNNWSCYVTGGGALEKGLGVTSKMKDLKGDVTSRKDKIDGLQWSVNLGVGLEYFFTNVFGIYFDPSLVYFFDCDQPFNIRTSQPLQFEMELGLRFNL